MSIFSIRIVERRRQKGYFEIGRLPLIWASLVPFLRPSLDHLSTSFDHLFVFSILHEPKLHFLLSFWMSSSSCVFESFLLIFYIGMPLNHDQGAPLWTHENCQPPFYCYLFDRLIINLLVRQINCWFKSILHFYDPWVVFAFATISN